jgi:hypothetical protein
MKLAQRIFQRLLCMHLNWTDSPLEVPRVGYTQVGYKDWRTDENYWGCTRCGKVNNFGWRAGAPNQPIQWVE